MLSVFPDYVQSLNIIVMNLLSKFIKKILSFSPWKITLAIILMLAAACGEGVGLLLLRPLLAFANITPGAVSGEPQDAVSHVLRFFHFNHATLNQVLVVYVVILSTIGILNYVKSWFNGSLQLKFSYNMQQELYGSFIVSPWQDIANTKRSDFNQLLTHEIDRVAFGINMLVQLVSIVVLTIIYLSMACIISWQLTLIAVGCGLVLYAILHYQTRLAFKIGKKDYECFRQLYSCINEHLLSAKLAKAYGFEGKFLHHFKKTAQKLVHLSTRYILLQGANSLFYTIGGAIIFSVIFYFSVGRFHIPLTSLFILLVIFARLVPKFSTFQRYYQNLARTLSAFNAVENMTQRFLKIKAELPPLVATNGEKNIINLQKSIRLKGVSFAYQGSRSNVLSDINLIIPAKKISVFAGYSGAGKSTLIDLIIGLLAPNSGEVLIDGQSIFPEQMLAWHNSIAYVPQDDCLLNDTIRNNLLWTTHGIAASDIDVALKKACIYDFVQMLPNQLETQLGDDGVGLSGGEKQRIMLARALLRKPSLLILDEATSALDMNNEAIIFEVIRKLREQLTVIIVTHRMSVLEFADHMFLVDGGKVKECDR